MIFRQITQDDLGCASYLIGDEDAGVAAVVDPRLDIDEYLRLARYMGARIEHVLETHNHIRAVPPGLDPSAEIAVICASGQRSAVAASLLARHGANAVIHVADGGVPAWQRAGWPLET
jgi:rhodanese-related sulfurtransferase